MALVPPCAVRLSLEEGADERAVRRAYARELKKIDQEKAPAEFQALREAYEAALEWARSGAHAVTVFEDVGPDPDAWPETPVDLVETLGLADDPAGKAGDLTDRSPGADEIDVPPGENKRAGPRRPRPSGANRPAEERELDAASPQALALVVFEELVADIEDEPLDKKQMRDLLARHLGDSRLLSLEARAEFEHAVLKLLTGGWRPGHEILFGAALDLFHWRDARRLKHFDGAGSFLDQALLEAASFNQQHESTRSIYLELMQRLRENGKLDAQGGLWLIENARQMIARYPHLMHILTSVENARGWERLEPALRAGGMKVHWSASPIVWVMVLACMVFFALWYGGMQTNDTVARWVAERREIAASPNPAPAAPSIEDPGVGNAETAALLRLPNTAESCKGARCIAVEHGVNGDRDLGIRFDRYVIICAIIGFWPSSASDPIVLSARFRVAQQRELRKNARADTSQP